ncbi:MAG TPA: glycosyltransferase family 1 protein [Acidimicrobiales bacterium]|nr:glycosyltransferase family 1 protein [Acidimicrobiales bacterium]
MVAEQLRRPVPGGIGTYVRGLLGGLRSVGPHRVAVTLWTSRAPRGDRDPLAPLGRVVASSLPGPALTRAWDRGLCPPPEGADVVHASSLAVPPSGRMPMSVMVHDLAWRHEPDAFPHRGREWHEAALGRARKRAALVLAPSAATADDLVAAGVPEDRVAVVEEGCDHLAPPDDERAAALLSRLGVEPGGGYLLTVSTLEPRKNLPRLLAAHALALSRLPEPWPLVVVGPTGWGPALPARPSVLLAGHVDGGVLSALYRGARLLAYVPLREGWGLPAVEAMACGTPVVATPMPSTGGAAFEVPPGDVEAIADGLVAVAEDDALRARLVESGKRRAAGLTWEKAAARHVALWTALTAG